MGGRGDQDIGEIAIWGGKGRKKGRKRQNARPSGPGTSQVRRRKEKLGGAGGRGLRGRARVELIIISIS